MIPYAIITSTGIAAILLGMSLSVLKTRVALLLGSIVVGSCGGIAVGLYAKTGISVEHAAATYVVLVVLFSLLIWGVSHRRG